MTYDIDVIAAALTMITSVTTSPGSTAAWPSMRAGIMMLLRRLFPPATLPAPPVLLLNAAARLGIPLRPPLGVGWM
jgi:hypothetical protein